MSEEFLNVAVVGAGYWGKNLVRNFATAKRCNLKYVCDLDEKLLAVQKRNFPFDVSSLISQISSRLSHPTFIQEDSPLKNRGLGV